MSIIIAILVLGVLIVIHELGHFSVAKLMGVYVEKFSIGFGPRLVGFKYGETEYTLSAFPLGGYVKMYGQEGAIEGEDVVDESKAGRSFTDKARWKRALIVLAGPVANILLAVLTFWVIYMSGAPAFSAIIGDVTPGSPAEVSGLVMGDKIIAVDDTQVKSWIDFSDYIELHSEQVVNVKLDGDRTVPVMVDKIKSKDIYGEDIEIGSIGAEIFIPAIIGSVVDGMPAALAQVKEGDKILSIDSVPITSWFESTKIIRSNPDKELNVTLDRNGETVSVLLTPKISNEGIGLVGISPLNGDITVSYGVFESLKMGFERSYLFTVEILKGLGKLLNRSVSTDQLGGPIKIVELGADSAKAGFTTLLLFMAIISMNLAVFNLLPIPVLDGGHLLILAVEGITRRKINERILGGVQTVGFVLLMSLMVFAFYNDISRMVIQYIGK